MSELTTGASYPARRNGAIAIKESESGALMAYIPFSIVDESISYQGNHSVCIGQKDGTLREAELQNLRDIYPAWTSENPFDLQRLDVPKGNEAEFKLVDWHNEPYTNTKGTEVDKWCFKWINSLTRGTLSPATQEEEQAILAKWGAKFKAVLGGTPAAKTTKPDTSTKTETPKAKTAPKAPKKPARTSDADTVYTAVATKHGITDASTTEQVEAFQNAHWWPVMDELFGKGNVANTPEQWGQVADKLGV